MAFVSWIGTFEGKKGTGKEKTTESELIRELYSLGAVPIGKVTVFEVYSILVVVLTLFQTSLVQSIWVSQTSSGHNLTLCKTQHLT